MTALSAGRTPRDGIWVASSSPLEIVFNLAGSRIVIEPFVIARELIAPPLTMEELSESDPVIDPLRFNWGRDMASISVGSILVEAGFHWDIDAEVNRIRESVGASGRALFQSGYLEP